ncbi:MAG: hypothetical protein PHS95_01730 [Candidatus Pacebacteria bacterium]|nr:hypothetical protein [Candidatus Paceibacterota bacterium]
MLDEIFNHFKKTGYLHHAHMIKGDAKVLIPILISSLKENMGIAAVGNPDVTILNYESLGVEESRILAEMQSHSAFKQSESDKDCTCNKIFIITTKSFTNEAQNALLKTIEEPTAGTHFFIIVPRIDTVLPTLLSRMIFVDETKRHKEPDEDDQIAELFLRSPFRDRFGISKKLSEIKKDGTVDREKIRHILDHLERILYERTAGKLSEHVFRELYEIKTYLSDRGSSPKILLDHLVLALPIIQVD